MKIAHSRKGQSILGLLGALLVAAVFAVVVLPERLPGRTHCGNSQLKDSIQLRGLQSGMITWAQDHPSPASPQADQLSEEDSAPASAGR